MTDEPSIEQPGRGAENVPINEYQDALRGLDEAYDRAEQLWDKLSEADSIGFKSPARFMREILGGAR